MYLLFRRYLKFGHILSDLLILLLGNAQRVLNLPVITQPCYKILVVVPTM